MSSNIIMYFEDGKIDDYGTITYKNEEFILKISNREKIKINDNGIYINNDLINTNNEIYEKILKWVNRRLKNNEQYSK